MSGGRRSYGDDISDSVSEAVLHEANGLEWNKVVLEEKAVGDETP